MARNAFKESNNYDVIDLACGTGHYTRCLKEMTSGKIVGVDISPDMINYGISQEKEEDLNKIVYYVFDCSIPFSEHEALKS